MAGRFKLDENLPRDAAALLRRSGHDIQTLTDERLGGSSDSTVVDACRTEGRILVTLDRDFADIRLYPPLGQAGVWVLRPATQSIGNILALLVKALSLLDVEPTEDRLWIVEPGRVRIRG
jgi:predicted nuclease of predicted toxin-antitoxin system